MPAAIEVAVSYQLSAVNQMKVESVGIAFFGFCGIIFGKTLKVISKFVSLISRQEVKPWTIYWS